MFCFTLVCLLIDDVDVVPVVGRAVGVVEGVGERVEGEGEGGGVDEAVVVGGQVVDLVAGHQTRVVVVVVVSKQTIIM